MATPTIPNGETQFFPIIYEGNGGGQRVGRFVAFTDNGTIDNSCIFDHGTNAYVSRTPSSNGSGTTLTFSCWIKRDAASLGSATYIMFTNDFSANGEVLQFDSSNRLYYYKVQSGWSYITNRTFEDTSKFYNILISRDTNDSTAGDRVKIYVDGDRITSFNSSSDPSSGATGFWNQTTLANVVGNSGNGSYIDGAGYLAEVNMVDGTAMDVSTFGVVDTSTNRWVPKTLSGITYGNNGFRLKFQDSSSLGDDTSGNGNDFSVTNIVAGDQTTDSPTQNFATLQGTGGTLSEGNLTLATGTSDFSHHNATLKPKSGKYYAEFTCNSMGRSEVGIASTTKLPYSANNVRLPATDDGSLAGIMWYGFNGNYSFDSGFSTIVSGTSYTTNDIIGIALDLDNLNVKFYKNNTLDKTFNIPNSNYTFAMGDGATGFGGGWTANFGQRSFTYTPPTGFVALQQDNLPETAKGISGLVWTKNRDSTDSHQLYDSSRGKQKVILPNATTAESTVTDGLQKFLAGGQQIEDNVAINTSGESYVSWNWVANGSTTASNTDGSITSTVQANTTAGFSIIQHTGTGSAGATYGHGLSQAPTWVITKNRDASTDWMVWHHKLTSAGYFLDLNNNEAQFVSAYFNSTAPSSSVITCGTSAINNGSGNTHITYAWHEVEGFSKFGSYTGNGNADGTFVYTGFKPALIIIKNRQRATNWHIYDTQRGTFNPTDKHLYPNATNAEVTGAEAIDILSNGFKLRSANAGTNRSGEANIFMSFASHPFVGDGVSPTTAR